MMISINTRYVFSAGQVLIPKGEYNGQKLTKLVRINMAPRTNKTIPTVPVTVPVKYNTAKMIATITLIVLSVLPIFFFIIICFV